MTTMNDCKASESKLAGKTETNSERPTESLNSTLHKTEEVLDKTSINYTNATLTTSRELNMSFLANV